jgi:hypothetical protein
MKTIKISDQTHAKLTTIIGKLMVETGKPKTYQDAIEALLRQSVVLPQNILAQIEDFIQKNKQFKYKTKEEFLKDAIRFRMEALTGENKVVLNCQNRTPKSPALNSKNRPPQFQLHSPFCAFRSENVLGKTFLALENTPVKTRRKSHPSLTLLHETSNFV